VQLEQKSAPKGHRNKMFADDPSSTLTFALHVDGCKSCFPSFKL